MIKLILILPLLTSPLITSDFTRATFYTGLHATNEFTTDWALKAPGTSESHTWLGMEDQFPRITVHSTTAITQILIDKELSKPHHPKWMKWGFRGLSLGIQGWAIREDLRAGSRARKVMK